MEVLDAAPVIMSCTSKCPLAVTWLTADLQVSSTSHTDFGDLPKTFYGLEFQKTEDGSEMRLQQVFTGP